MRKNLIILFILTSISCFGQDIGLADGDTAKVPRAGLTRISSMAAKLFFRKVTGPKYEIVSTNNTYNNPAFIASISLPKVTGLQDSLSNTVKKIAGKGLSSNDFSTAEKSKLAGIESGATANSTDTQLRDRTTHTGVQGINTISALQDSLNNKVTKMTGKGLSTNDFSTAYKNDVDANTIVRHSHINKALLDTYTQTELNLADAVVKKHAHANQAVLDGTTSSFLSTDRMKLDGIDAGATANSSDAYLLSRSNHTGTQTATTITGLATVATTGLFSDLLSKPTTIIGYGITDYNSLFDTRLATKSTSDIAEASNLYWTNSRGDARYPQLSGSYSNPTWITSLANSKITGLGSLALLNTVSLTSNVTGLLPDANISSSSIWSAKQNALSGTGFVKIVGSTISYDNSTYLTTSTASSTYAPVNNPTFTGTVSGITKTMVGLGNVDNTSDLSKPISPATQTALATKQATLAAGQGIQLSGATISSVITSDTTTAPASGGYRIALTSDSLFRVVNSAGKVYALQHRLQAWIMKPVVIDSTLSSYTIIDNRSLNFSLASTESFSNSTLGKYNIYTSNLFYYLPKFISNYTIGLNLPNPALSGSSGLVISLMMNKKCTINFNYPIYYTLRNGQGGLTTDTDYGLSQMNPTLQAIPSTNFRATWFVSHDSAIYQFYVFENKWYIK